VHVEHIEAAGLIGMRGEQPWLISLHDVTRSAAGDDPADHHEQTLLQRYDAVVATSAEDLALLDHPMTRLVENGSAIDPRDYRPSPDAGPVLFIGAFRHRPNHAGILDFLATGWPAVLQQIPQARLQIIGGDGAVEIAAGDRRFAQPGVEVVERVDALLAAYRACSLCINPQRAIRGSALKVIEALSAGRICVSTDDGARGFTGMSGAALRRVVDMRAMADEIVDLLREPERRWRDEAPDSDRLAAHGWAALADRQAALFEQLLAAAG
jgi:glycosyltransferase involved in cell wall biosynthesis